MLPDNIQPYVLSGNSSDQLIADLEMPGWELSDILLELVVGEIFG